MLPLEQQVCALEYSQRLKELGVKQESLFYWFRQFKDDDYLLHYVDYIHHETGLKILKERFPDCYSAFTVAELMYELPLLNSHPIQLLKGANIMEEGIIYCCRCEGLYSVYDNSIFADKNPANSCAKMRIYLIENGYI